MNKVMAKRRIQTLLASKGLSTTYTTGRIADRIAIKNKKGECVASGTIKLDSSKKGYKDADLSATLKAMRSLNCTADFEGEDAEFIEDAELIVEDENGNTIDVDSMLVVQDPDSNEISLWVPEEGETENDLPPTVTVIGVVSEPLDSIDRLDKLNSDCSGDSVSNCIKDLKAYWDENHDSSPHMQGYSDFNDWFTRTTQWFEPIDSTDSNKLNSAYSGEDFSSMSRGQLMDYLEDNYNTMDNYTQLEDAIEDIVGFIPDDSGEEGLYTQISTDELFEIASKLDAMNSEESIIPITMNLTSDEYSMLKSVLEMMGDKSFSKSSRDSKLAKDVLRKLT